MDGVRWALAAVFMRRRCTRMRRFRNHQTAAYALGGLASVVWPGGAGLPRPARSGTDVGLPLVLASLK